jgi:membrane-associated phospholipid phosphatase
MPEGSKLGAGPAPDHNPGTIVSKPRAAKRARWAVRVFVAALSIYALLALLANRYAYFAWDLVLARRIQSIELPGFAALMSGVSILGDGWVAWPLVAVAGLGMISAMLRTEAVVCTAGVFFGWIVNQFLKFIVARPRPAPDLVHVTGVHQFQSFPSGHVIFFVEFFGFLFFLSYVLLERGLLRRVALGVLGLLIALVGLSRIYLGAHWPSDVTGAYLAGGIWLMLCIEAYRRLKSRSS